ncbi:conserved hypothetical protein [Streptococcus agalactiae CJB111]|nr:conserved hypothetical protein [Streptococcus agalactiae CJB111]
MRNAIIKTVSQIILAWEVKNKVTVISKTVHKARIMGNMDFFDILLTDDDMTKIASLEKSEYLFGDVESLELIEYLSNNVFDI